MASDKEQLQQWLDEQAQEQYGFNPFKLPPWSYEHEEEDGHGNHEGSYYEDSSVCDGKGGDDTAYTDNQKNICDVWTDNISYYDIAKPFLGCCESNTQFWQRGANGNEA